MMKRLALLAFSGEFFKGGWSQTRTPDRYAGRAQQTGLPVGADFIRACGWTMMAAAAALHIPFLRRPAALILALLLAPITFVGHRFWETADAQQREQQLTQVFKNASMLGGALFIASSK